MTDTSKDLETLEIFPFVFMLFSEDNATQRTVQCIGHRPLIPTTVIPAAAIPMSLNQWEPL
jgi:hypothetical protein